MNNILTIYNEFDNHHFELNVDHYGAEICTPGYSFGPSIRDNYVLHFIIDGCGRFTIDGKTILLKAGDLFILPKNKKTFYQADFENPWTYIWVGFSGSKAESLLQQSILLEHYYAHSNLSSKILDQMTQLTCFRDEKLNNVTDLLLMAELYKLLGFLIQELPNPDIHTLAAQHSNYVRQAKKLIHSRYGSNLKVQDIAQMLNLNRSYLYRIFKEETGLSLKDYIMQVRINKACDLLRTSSLSIHHIASSIGYSDALNFSKIFKKEIGKSPSSYRNSS